METRQCLRHHGYIVMFLVVFLSCFVGKISGSYAKGFKIHSGRKLVPSGSKYGEPMCGIHEPGDAELFFAFCQDKGYVMDEVKFADYGQPTGRCDTFKRGKCGAPATLRLTKENCEGKERCILYMSEEMFGPTNCKGPISFGMLATCKKKVA